MDSASMNTEMQALLAHSHWVQELARRLVRDPNVAEDLAQETMLAALREGDTRHRSVKAWLGTVLRNLVWERVRRDDRRGAREVDAARDEAVPSTVDLLDRMSAHQEVVDVLMTLPEAYREVLLRRYFEGEAPAEIAEELGVPHSTVRTRLSRATAMMRERLDAEHGGDGRSWMAALAPLVRAPLRPVETSAAAGVFATALPWLAVAGVALVALAAWSLVREPDGLRPADTVLRLPAVDVPVPPRPPRSDDAAPLRAELGGETSATPSVARRSTQAPVEGRLRGRVVDLDGRPRAGVLLRFERFLGEGAAPPSRAGDRDPLVISDADGSFELADAWRSGWVVAEGGPFVTVLAGAPSTGGARDELIVVTAPTRGYAGRVLDEDGAPVVEARLALELPRDWTRELGLPLDASAPVPFETTSASGGRFELPAAPALAGQTLVVRAEGHEAARFDLPHHDDRGLELTLATPVDLALELAGQVVDASGLPVAGARVSSGTARTACDADGLFRLPVEESPEELRALAPGVGFTRLARTEASVDGEDAWPDHVVLRLGAEPRSLRGRLVDGEGRGMRSVRVWAADPTLFWRGSGDGREDSSVRVGVVPLGSRVFPELVESLLAGTEPQHDSPWPFVLTDEDGAFELHGLLDRPYRLAFFDARTLLHMRTEPFSPDGAPVLVRWAASSELVELRGRVVSKRGEPLAGLDVRAMLTGFELMDGDVAVWSEQRLSRAAVTDAEGRFRLSDVPLDGLVTVEGPDLPLVVQGTLADLVAAEEPELEVSVVGRLSVTLADPDRADSFRLTDARGEAVAALRVEGPRRTTLTEVPLEGGSSGVLLAPVEATSLVLLRDGERVQEVAIELARGRTATLEL